MAHEVVESIYQGHMDHGLRIDCALTSVAQGGQDDNYEIILISNDDEFITVEFRDGIGVGANVYFRPVADYSGVQQIEAYEFVVTETGWEIYERKRPINEEAHSLSYIDHESAEEPVANLESIVKNSTVIGYSPISEFN